MVNVFLNLLCIILLILTIFLILLILIQRGKGGGLAGAARGHAIGNDYVPYNNYPAMLHRGEAVLTAREADAWRRGENGRQIVNNFSFNGVSQSDLDYIVGYVNRELVSG